MVNWIYSLAKVLFIFITLLISTSIYSQENIEKPDSIREATSIPRFDVHIGVGFIEGGRIGGRVQFFKNFSSELAFGYNWANFLGRGNLEERYTFGINWHMFEDSRLTTSLLVTSVVLADNPGGLPDNKLFNYFYITTQVGSLSMIKSGFHFFIRGGITFSFNKGIPMDKVKYRSIGFDIDTGVGYSFP